MTSSAPAPAKVHLLLQRSGVQATGVAVAYFLLGLLGLQLVSPLSYASPLFPATGLALALLLLGGSRLAPGLWLGVLAFNVYEPWSRDSLSWHSWWVPLVITCGSMAQAGLGATLIRRQLGERWRELAQERGVGCLLAAA